MTMPRVAGHTFEDRHDAVCACGRAWADIAAVTDAQVGEAGIAHQGQLTSTEAREIAEERERRLARAEAIWGAVVAGAGA